MMNFHSFEPVSISGPAIQNLSPVIKTNDTWSFRDWIGTILVRMSPLRNTYAVAPGLYQLGNPDRDSEVFISANYKLSFDILRKNLAGINCWVLVLDTRGINVWCAAGKGTFGTDELIQKIQSSEIATRINHKRVIVPQLGGVGISAHSVKKATGFRVVYGPVEAEDITAFLGNNRRATPEMRKVHFSLPARLVLIPMEFIPAMRYFLYYAGGILLVSGLRPEGILFSAMIPGLPYVYAGLTGVISGSVLSPALLPLIPLRAFSAKGALLGILSALALQHYLVPDNIYLSIFLFSFIPAVSSFFALQFTGSSTYTNLSGVKKEHRIALPLYIIFMVISAAAFVVHKAVTW